MASLPVGAELSLNEGLGAMACSRNPVMGTRPSGDGCIHIVPPVMMMSTRDSGRWLSFLPSMNVTPPILTAGGFSRATGVSEGVICGVGICFF